jgi:caspase domain-containing protein
MIRARSLLASLCLFVALLSANAAAAADRRVALVVGNSAYSNAPKLANTVADAVGLAQLFRSAGFETVILRKDLGVMDFRRAVRDFLVTAEGADIAVVYYAGHGIEIGGTNYLIPVDAKLSRTYDVDDEAVPLDRIIGALQAVKRLRLILLDACRDNPFPDHMRSAGVRALGSSGLGKPIDVGADTLVAYAAKAGSKSYDGDGQNSPYATALLRHLAEPGIDIRIALGRVRDDVLAMTGGRQEPFIYGSLGGATIPLVAQPTAAAEKIEPKPAPLPRDVEGAKAMAMIPVSPQRSPQPVEAVDPSQACNRDKQRLERLRVGEPTTDQIMKFQRELACESLRPQVQRLLESVGGEPAVAQAPKDSAPQQPMPAGYRPEEICARETERLQRLRADPNPDEIRKFERDLSCEQLRPQVQRLCDSICR